MTVKITPTDNGPYMVEGTMDELKMFYPSGQEIPLKGNKVYLCRCGGSTKKPFCDGTHSRIGFQAAEAAVARQESQAKA